MGKAFGGSGPLAGARLRTSAPTHKHTHHLNHTQGLWCAANSRAAQLKLAQASACGHSP